jgi:iron complex outermembrane recepter protein
MHKRQLVVLLLFLVLTPILVSAQQERPNGYGYGRPQGMNRDSLMKNMPAIGKVIGVLRDSASKEPLEFASIALIRLRDSSAVGGSLTDAKGHFNIAEIQPGRYKLRVSCIGYKTFDTAPFLITPQEALKDFGILNMPANLRTLKEVNVTEEKQEYTNTLDKKVFNVDKNLISTGGTVSDVLQNVPSVQVDIDGNVSLRGSENVTVLIDGKPSGLTAENRAALLRQIPASSIDQIEVVTNPGARYDAEGMTGIINIKTKKDKRNGLNGTASVGIGTRDKYNASVSVNRRSKLFNLYGNYGYRRDDRFFNGYSDRTNLYDSSFNYIRNNGLSRNKSHNLKAGADWYINDYNVLGVSGGLNLRNEFRREFSSNLIADDDPYYRTGFSRISKSPEDGSTYDGSIDYKKTFPGSKRELSGNVNATYNLRNSVETFYTSPYDSTTVSDQRQVNDRNNASYGGQLDYVHPTQKVRYETGVKVTVRDNQTEQRVDRYDVDRELWLTDARTQDKFDYRDEVYAGYLQAGAKFGKIETQAGLRTEYTRMIGDSRDTSFNRGFVDPFPSLTLRYNVKKDHDLQIGYSRRINRPDGRQLNPFVTFSDSLNLQRGNPGINPEYVHAIELGYQGRYKEQSISVTLYYRYIDNYIQRFRTIDPQTAITLTTFENFSSAENRGLEVVLRNNIYKGVTLNTTFNGFFNKVNASNLQTGLTSDVFTWDIRSSLNAKVAKNTSVQITGNYMAPRVNPQGTFFGMQGVDLGIRQDFKGGKWSANLAVSDVFDNRQFEITNDTDLFKLDSVRKRESRVATLTLTYNFGKSDGNPFRKRQGRSQDQQPDMMDF